MNKLYHPLALLSILSLIIIGELVLIYASVKDEISPLVAQSEVATNHSENATTLLFVGDIMLGRNVERLMESKGHEYPFSAIQDFLKSYSTVVANLEGPIPNKHVPTPLQGMQFSFPSYVPSLLAQNNITYVSLGNNHGYDHGAQAFFQTISALATQGIRSAGNPYSISEEYVLRTTINDKAFVFLSFNATHPTFDYVKAVALAKTEHEKNDKAIIVALVHWGDEYILTSNVRQREFAHSLIDAGVDALIGHHPHVVEEIEEYNGAPIFYSLGNFIFDQYFSTDVEEGLAVELTFQKEKITYKLYPLEGGHSQPRLMQSPSREAFLTTLSERSRVADVQCIVNRVCVID